MVVLSPRAVERLESYRPPWPLPKIFRMTRDGELNEGLFEGETINTPSMLCVEDYLKLRFSGRRAWGGVEGLVKRAECNAKVLLDWMERTPWVENLAADPGHGRLHRSALRRSRIRPYRGLSRDGQATFSPRRMVKLLHDEGVAFDIGPTATRHLASGSGRCDCRSERSRGANSSGSNWAFRAAQGRSLSCSRSGSTPVAPNGHNLVVKEPQTSRLMRASPPRLRWCDFLFHTRGFPVIRTLTIALLLSVSGSAAFAADIDAASAVDAVTVFPQGAEITRVAKVSVDRGDHVLIFRDLPAEAVEGSIRVERQCNGQARDRIGGYAPPVRAAGGCRGHTSERRNIERELEGSSGSEGDARSAGSQRRDAEQADREAGRAAGAPGTGRRPPRRARIGPPSSASSPPGRGCAAGAARRAGQDARCGPQDPGSREQAWRARAGSNRANGSESVPRSAQAPLEADVTIRYQVVSASWTPLYDVCASTGGQDSLAEARAHPSCGHPLRAAAKRGTTWPLRFRRRGHRAGASAPELSILDGRFRARR